MLRRPPHRVNRSRPQPLVVALPSGVQPLCGVSPRHGQPPDRDHRGGRNATFWAELGRCGWCVCPGRQDLRRPWGGRSWTDEEPGRSSAGCPSSQLTSSGGPGGGCSAGIRLTSTSSSTSSAGIDPRQGPESPSATTSVLPTQPFPPTTSEVTTARPGELQARISQASRPAASPPASGHQTDDAVTRLFTSHQPLSNDWAEREGYSLSWRRAWASGDPRAGRGRGRLMSRHAIV